jgi:hypothetical protein
MWKQYMVRVTLYYSEPGEDILVLTLQQTLGKDVSGNNTFTLNN